MNIRMKTLTLTAALLAGTITANARPMQRSENGEQSRRNKPAVCPCCHQIIRQQGNHQGRGQNQQFNQQGRGHQGQQQAQQFNRQGRGQGQQQAQQFNRQGRGQGQQTQQLSKQEQVASQLRQQKMRQLREKALEKYDSDGDGKLSADERSELKEAVRARHQKHNEPQVKEHKEKNQHPKKKGRKANEEAFEIAE